ncbi:MAG: sigma-70 family RNA polymerase sigma factor [Bacteroidota bacterium]
MKETQSIPRELLDNLSQKSSSQLQAFAMSLTKDINEAEDLFQETLYLALKNGEKFREGTNFMAWMKTIMRNAFINGYRRKKRFLAYVNEKVNTYFSEKPKARNAAESNILMKELSRMIEDVDDRFNKPFKMFYQGFSYEEIAETLGLPLGTVKSRIFIARKQIKQAYRQNYEVPVGLDY